MNAKLVVVVGKTTKREVDLRLPTVLGRSGEADLTIAHPLISRRHCEISESGGLLMLRDLGSLNGTMIDGRRVESAPLLPNAEFTIGPVTFQVLYDFDGDLESVPPTQFLDEPVEMTEAGIQDAMEDGMPDEMAFEVDEDVPVASIADGDSGEMQVADLMALADAEVEEAIPAEIVPLAAAPRREAPAKPLPPEPIQAEILPDEPQEPQENDSSLQSGSHRKESPWATEPRAAEVPAPAVEAKRPAAKTEKPPATKAPAAKPAAEKADGASAGHAPRQPGYGDEMDPEFGSFLEGLQ